MKTILYFEPSDATKFDFERYAKSLNSYAKALFQGARGSPTGTGEPIAWDWLRSVQCSTRKGRCRQHRKTVLWAKETSV